MCFASASFLDLLSKLYSLKVSFTFCSISRVNIPISKLLAIQHSQRDWFALYGCVHSQGDRFGGALDGAARQFSGAYDSGMIPMEFVNSMRRQHKLILGIGHRVKSVCVCV